MDMLDRQAVRQTDGQAVRETYSQAYRQADRFYYMLSIMAQLFIRSFHLPVPSYTYLPWWSPDFAESLASFDTTKSTDIDTSDTAHSWCGQWHTVEGRILFNGGTYYQKLHVIRDYHYQGLCIYYYLVNPVKNEMYIMVAYDRVY